MIQIELPLRVESLNKMLRLHWQARRRLKQQWGIVLANKILQAGKASKRFYGNVRIHALRSRLLDKDNLVGGCKEIIVDNLKDLGLIEDDSPGKVKVSYLQTKTKRSLEGTVIAIW